MGGMFWKLRKKFLEEVKISQKDSYRIIAAYANVIPREFDEVDHHAIIDGILLINKQLSSCVSADNVKHLIFLSKTHCKAISHLISAGNAELADTDSAIGGLFSELFMQEYNENSILRTELQKAY
jgi:hypothetical protein